jgi:glycosyltransferase involved in cell wall biosynthesis
LKNKTRSGPGVARNKGLDNSYNRYILMLDADDYFTKDTALEEIYNRFLLLKEKNKNCKLLSFMMSSDEKSDKEYKAVKSSYIYDRECLKFDDEKPDLRFLNLFFAEDLIFNKSLWNKLSSDEIINCSDFNTYIAYGLEDNNNNLTTEIGNLSKNSTTPSALDFTQLTGYLYYYRNIVLPITNTRQNRYEFFTGFTEYRL